MQKKISVVMAMGKLAIVRDIEKAQKGLPPVVELHVADL